MPIGYGTNTGGLASSFANASASSSRVTLESKDDKPSVRTRNKLLPWSRRGRKSASAEYVKDNPNSDTGIQDTQIFAGRSLSSSPGGSEEALETHVETLIPTPWPCEGRPENCPSITSVPPYKHRTFYRLHAPAGPPFYINHHLRPPNQSAFNAAQSPVSAFSSSFPPLAAIPQGSPPIRTIRLGLAAPSDQQYSSQVHQSSSESVLPTPDSSTSIGFAGASSVSYQNRDELNAMPIGNLLAAADVDQLDVSSPWGQRFHHDSPYDLGQRKGKKPVRTMGGFGSVSATDLRTRVPSNSRFSRPTTPSPLSQSTPAVNIQSQNENILQSRRKLSKRKPSGLQAPPTTSPSPDSDSPSDSRNNPSPVDYGAPESTVSMTTATAISQNASSQVTDSTLPDLSRKLSKKRPTQFPSTPGYISSPEKNRGANVFSRMAKRISFGMGSFMSGPKRGMVFERRPGHKGSLSMTDVTVLSNERYNPSRNDSSLVTRDEPPQQEPKRQGPKRVPPPSFEEAPPSSSIPASQASIEPLIPPSTLDTAPESSTAPQLPKFIPDSTSFNIMSQFQQNDIRDSLLSTDTEPEWSLGKLTIANPDLAGGSDTDTSLRGKQKNPTPLPRPQDRLSLVDPDPRASIRAEVNSRSSFHDLDDRLSRSFTSETVTPVQNLQPLQTPTPGRPEQLIPPPPPKDRESTAISETIAVQDLRVSMTESSVTPTSSRLSSRVSSPELPPTPQDVSVSSSAPSDAFPPQLPSKTAGKPKVDVSIPESQNSHSDASAISSSSNHHSSTEIVSPAKSRLGGRQEHIYIVDVPVDGPLFVRPSPDGTSIPPIEKPELPPLPPKPKAPENITNPPLAASSSVRQSKERKEKETTIFTSLFSTPRSRRTSETSPKEGSPHDRGSQGLSSRPTRRTRNSPDKPDKPSSATVAHSRSPTSTSETESHSREERVKSERDRYGSRRGDRRSYLEKRDDSDRDSGHKHREPRSHSQDEDRELRREQERRQAEYEERQARERAKERERQRLREEEERAARERREREDEERRARRAREREEEERRERKAREKEEEQRRLKRAKEKEEEERRLRRAKEREEEERRAREDEERRLRRMKEKQEEERRVQREKERIEEEKKARREKEEQERRIRKAREEEERERERRERRRLEEERRLKKEEEERRWREEERRKRKEEEEKRRKEEEELRKKREEEERKAKREEEERRRRREEEERRKREEEERRRREEEERRRREEEERRRRIEEERRSREEEERKLREQEESRREEERKARKQQKEMERLEAIRRAQEEAEWKERERQERRAREEQLRREKERELIRQREMEIEEKRQEESSWVPETKSFYSMFSDRPITSTAGSSYFSNYASSYMGGYDWEPAERPRAKKRSYDIHDPVKQAQARREPARLPDINRRAELGVYSPESSSTYYRRPRAVSLESAPSQPPTPPYKDKGSSLRRQRTDGRVHPSVSADDTIFVRPRVPRPVSGIPSPGVFKASEAWEHDRFWRGQSMNFDSGSVVSGSLPPASWADHQSYSYETGVPSVSYYPSIPHQGSSYTSYTVQPPAWSYPHYQPAAPIEPFSIPPSSNPLPPPPRQSHYRQSHSTS